MSTLTISKRYANALFGIAEKSDAVKQIDSEVEFVIETLAESRPLRLMLESPVVPTEKKKSIAARLFGDRVHASLLVFLTFVIDKGRESMLESILEEYKHLRDTQENIVRAKLTSAHALSGETAQRIQHSLESISGKHVALSLDVDESLIGGIVVRVGDTVYDGSIRQQLDSLKEKMTRGQVALVN